MTDKIYIGSTIKCLEKRLEEHEHNYELWFCNDFNKYYCTSFEILKYPDYQIFLIEEYGCLNYTDLFKREGFHQINNYILCVNTYIAGGKRSSTKLIDICETYQCYCGKNMLNKWKTRYKHIHTDSHKKLVKKINLEMITTNPNFEVS